MATALDSSRKWTVVVLEEAETNDSRDLELRKVPARLGMCVEAAAFSRKLVSPQQDTYTSTLHPDGGPAQPRPCKENWHTLFSLVQTLGRCLLRVVLDRNPREILTVLLPGLPSLRATEQKGQPLILLTGKRRLVRERDLLTVSQK